MNPKNITKDSPARKPHDFSFYSKILKRLLKTLYKLKFLLFSLLVCAGVFFYLQHFLGHDPFWAKFNYFHSFTKLKTVAEYPLFYLQASKLPQYQLEIPGKSLRELEQIHQTRDVNYLPATFFANGKEYKVDIRYHGDLPEHWVFDKKSWKIKFKNKSFEGNNKISLILPITRQYMVEFFNNHRAKKMGLITPESKLVTLTINGQFQGVYLQFESWDEDFLIKNERNPIADLFDGDVSASKNTGGRHLFWRLTSWEKDIEFPHSFIEDYAAIRKLYDIFHSSTEEFNSRIGDIIDLDSFYRWNAHSTLTKSFHQDHHHNLRLYLNPDKGKFEFVPWDVGLQSFMQGYSLKHFSNPAKKNYLIKRLLSHLPFLVSRNQKLWVYLNDDENLTNDLTFYDEAWQTARRDFYLGNDEKLLKINPAIVPPYGTADHIVQEFRLLIKSYSLNIYQELQQNEIKVAIQVPPPPSTTEKSQITGRILAKIIIKPGEPAISPTLLRSISFSVPPDLTHSEGKTFSLYFDNNHNKLLEENEDTLLAEMVYQVDLDTITFDRFNPINSPYPEKIVVTQDQQVLLYSTPFVPKNGYPFNFFIIANDSNLSISNLSLDLENSTTGEKSLQTP